MADMRSYSNAIKHPPAQTLLECLELEGGGLIPIAMRQDLFDVMDLASPEDFDEITLMNRLLRRIPEEFSYAIQFFSAEQIELVEQTIACMKAKRPIPEGDSLDSYPHLNCFGYLYLFEWNEKLWTVLPAELWPVWEKSMADVDLPAKRKHCQEMMTYAKGLTSLYGFCDFEHFANMWNQHHLDKITEEYAVSLLNEGTLHQTDFDVNEHWIMHESLFEDEESIDKYLESAAGLPYYRPSEKLIQEYACDALFHDYSAEAKRLHSFFHRNLTLDKIQREDLNLDVVISCEQSWDVKVMTKILLECHFPMQDKALLQEYGQLYISLWNNTRQWALRGHTPAEARELGADIPDPDLPDASHYVTDLL